MAHNMRLWLRERREATKNRRRAVAPASAAGPGEAGRHHQD
jgi:hypothetical protein